MENYIVIEGKKIELSKETVENFKKQLKEESPWRAKLGGKYFFVCANGGVEASIERRCQADEFLYNVGNYFETVKEAMRAADDIFYILKARQFNTVVYIEIKRK